MFEARSTADLVRIAAAGGGFTLGAGPRSTEDLVRIAAAASNNGSRIVFLGLAARSTEDIVRIAAAGRGCVAFGDDST